MKSYTLTDGFDGRVLKSLSRVSTRRVARQHALRFCCEVSHGEDFCLIETTGRGRSLVDVFYGSRK